MKNDMQAAIKAIMSQLGTWDAIEETWEIDIPLKNNVTVDIGDVDWFDLSNAIHVVLRDHGIGYNSIRPGKMFSIIGIHIR